MLRAPFTEKTASPDVDGEPWGANYPAPNARVVGNDRVVARVLSNDVCSNAERIPSSYNVR